MTKEIFSSKYIYLLFIIIFLVSCGGTFTHRGKNISSTKSNFNNQQEQAERCHAVCNQTNPDGSCGNWLSSVGMDCLKIVKKNEF